MKRILFPLALFGLFLAHPFTGSAQAVEQNPPFAGSAQTSEKTPAYNHEQFEMCDKNKDGYLSKDEFLTCWPGQEDKFTKMNTAGDGKLTPDEMRIGWPELHNKSYPDGSR